MQEIRKEVAAPAVLRRIGGNIGRLDRIGEILPRLLNRNTVDFFKAADVGKRFQIDTTEPEIGVFFHSVFLLKIRGERPAEMVIKVAGRKNIARALNLRVFRETAFDFRLPDYVQGVFVVKPPLRPLAFHQNRRAFRPRFRGSQQTGIVQIPENAVEAIPETILDIERNRVRQLVTESHEQCLRKNRQIFGGNGIVHHDVIERHP